MKTRYRKKTELEVALSLVAKDTRSKSTAKKLSDILGGDPSGWGRILKGEKITGDYHARLKVLKDNYSPGYILSCAEKSKRYGHRNRKGNLVIHPNNIFNDINNFREQKLFKNRIKNVSFDDFDLNGYYEKFDSFYSEGPHPVESLEEEIDLWRDFLNSLE